MRRSFVLISLVGVAAWAAACGSSSDGSSFDDGSTADGGEAGSGNDLSGNGLAGPDGSIDGQTLHIDPPTATLNATGSLGALTGSVSFKALVGTSTTPAPANWSIDDVGIGSIDASGTFTPGKYAGKTTVRATVGNLQATAEITISLQIGDDFTTLSPADKAALRAGGTTDVAFRWLYPYDRTVFPRGLPAPRMQLSGAAPQAFYVHVKSNQLDYEGFYPGGSVAARVTLSQALWQAFTKSAQASDPITVQVSKLEAGGVTGPLTETWNVAQGSLKGTVFYNSYNSKLASSQVGSNGAVLRLKPGTSVEVLIGQANVGGTTKKCVVCHSVSARGNRLVAGIDWNGGNPVDSGSFSIATVGSATQDYTKAEGRMLPFGALSPDGAWLVGNGVSGSGPELRGLAGTFPSRLYDAATGAVVADAYFGAGTSRYVTSPAFSVDGKHLAFNDKGANSGGHELAMLDVDTTKTPPTFANRTTLVNNANKVVAWPTFLPDGAGVLYHEGDSFDTGAWTSGTTLGALYADLRWIDLATKAVGSLDALNGWRKNGNGALVTYLPYGEGEDAHMNYEPTLLPVPVGGYYWVVFTSRRSFGNTIYNGPSSLTSGGDKAFDNPEVTGKGFRKKLWVAAIDIGGAPGTDISHPAFYLEGQEAEAGNMRGFWALDQCKQDGSTCEGGDECCGGFCRQVNQNGSVVNQCVPPPTTCANDSEKCTVDADCCNAASGVKCVGGYCALPSSPPPR